MHRQAGRPFTFHHGPVFTSLSRLLVVALLPTSSFAQSTTDTSSTASGSISPTSMSTTPGISEIEPPRSMTTSFIASFSPNATLFTPTSTIPTNTPTDLILNANQPNTQQVRSEGVFNYYFLFLALFGVLTAVSLWYIHRRRTRRKEQMRLSGQNALARDMDGWINTRRWFHGTWRHYQTAAFVRREEGLNERGEPPPPYQPKSAYMASHDDRGTHEPTSGLAIPMRTLSREEVEQRRPPEYRETVGGGGASISRTDTADTNMTHPDTRDMQRTSSERDLLTNRGTNS